MWKHKKRVLVIRNNKKLIEESKSLVMAELVICGENIKVEEITNLLDITPKRAFNKNDKNAPMPISKKTGSWEIATEYEVSPDSHKQLKKIIKLLSPRIEELQQIKKKWKCDFIFSLVIEIYGSQCPSVYLEEQDIEFFHQIGATYDVDIYYMGGYEEEDTYRG